jgi:DNA polymerase-3 subunit epsilon
MPRACKLVAEEIVSETAFLAIDFETAATFRGSACALGVALFDHGRLRYQQTTLIDPGIAPDDWHGYSIALHGIRREDVVGAPSFADVWNQVENSFPGVPLIAHHAGFDIGVLRAEFARMGKRPAQIIRYTCSALMARRAWPDLVSVSLPVLAEKCNITLDHHKPGSDARASGQIILSAADSLGAFDVNEALRCTGAEWGQIRADLSATTGTTVKALRAADFVPAADDALESPLRGQTIVFTGALQSMTRPEAFGLVARAGARPGDGVTKATNVLVVGEQDIARLAMGETLSAKHRKAAAMRLGGHDIQIVSEPEFLRMV